MIQSLIYNIVKYLDTSWWQIDVCLDAVGKQMSVRVVSVKVCQDLTFLAGLKRTGYWLPEDLRPKHGLHITHRMNPTAFRVFLWLLYSVPRTFKDPLSFLYFCLFSNFLATYFLLCVIYVSKCVMICFTVYSSNILLAKQYISTVL